MATVRMQAALFHSRERRRERFRKAGAGYPDPALLVSPGTAIASPVTAAQGQAAAFLVWSFEFFDGTTYPVGVLFDTDETIVELTAAGVLTVEVPKPPPPATNTITVDLSDPTIFGGGQPPHGRHTIAVFVDPPGNRVGLYVDGDQVGEDTGAFTEWADGVATWTYMNSVTDADAIDDLEIFLDFVPPTFVG